MDPVSVPPQKFALVDEQSFPTTIWYRMFISIARALATLQTGYSGTIATAPVTGSGTAGQMVFQNGRLISQIQAT